jgi:hypothetical protein
LDYFSVRAHFNNEEIQAETYPPEASITFPARTWSDEWPFRPFAPWSGHAAINGLVEG